MLKEIRDEIKEIKAYIKFAEKRLTQRPLPNFMKKRIVLFIEEQKKELLKLQGTQC